MTAKLSDYYDYNRLSKYEGLRGKLECRAPTTFVGVEIELEKVKFLTGVPSSVTIENDGSLKLDGKEFITVPLRFCYLEQELIRLFGSIKPPHISSRCSVHVHLNARDFTEQELFRFILLYLVFEKGLFRISGARDKNIFCTPLYSYIPKVAQQIPRLLKEGGITAIDWHKYFALNLCPIWGGEEGASKKIGTVEFRHLEGTTDIARIIEWINLIVSLKLYAKKSNTDDLLKLLSRMNTTSEYTWLTHEVFKKWHHYFTDSATYKEEIEHGVLVAKECLLPQDKKKVEIVIPFKQSRKVGT